MAQTVAKLVRVDEASVQQAAKLVLAGKLVAYPTDTVYGLGCNPFDKDAVDRLILAKQRVKGALPILVDSMAAAKKLGDFTRTALTLAGRYWPGPLTLIVPLREKLPEKVTGDSASIGLRIPKHAVALDLIKKCGGYIIGTSANVSGQTSSRTADDVFNEIGGQIDLILDGGPTPLGRESTVARVLGGSVDVLREGCISRDEILKTVKAG